MNVAAAHAAFVMMTVSAASMYWLLRQPQHARDINIHELAPPTAPKKSAWAVPIFFIMEQSREWVTQSDPWPKWPIELLTHDPCDPWPMGHRGRHPILNQQMIGKFTADTKRTKTSICCLIVGLLQYWIDYWIVKQWKSTTVKTNEMPF